jgi:hypothetical protein
MDIDRLLEERGAVHGDFTVHARVTQVLKSVIGQELQLARKVLTFEAQESLDMITHKIGRIVAGDPSHADHWDDIAGYATLVSQRIKSGVLGRPEHTPAPTTENPHDVAHAAVAAALEPQHTDALDDFHRELEAAANGVAERAA